MKEPSNKSLERTGAQSDRTVRAVALCARAGAQWQLGSTVQQDR
jgi:hypothetical protein